MTMAGASHERPDAVSGATASSLASGMSGKNLTRQALTQYSERFRGLDPQAIAARTGLLYDTEEHSFSFCLAGFDYRASWPDFQMQSIGQYPGASDYERILMLRYFCEGRFIPATGKEINYREIPDARIYEAVFDKRVNQRLLHEFARDPDTLKHLLEKNAGFQAEPLGKCDFGYRFMLLDGLPVSLRFWWADEEFPASASLVFDESFRFAFGAEDLAIAGGILVEHLIWLRGQLSGAEAS